MDLDFIAISCTALYCKSDIATFYILFSSPVPSRSEEQDPPQYPSPNMSSSSTISTSYRVKVITDIDDCVKSSGGVKLFGIALGGIDKQYDRGQFYPGMPCYHL